MPGDLTPFPLGLTVATGAEDYPPGSTAAITAGGFDSGSTIQFSLRIVDAGADGIIGTADDVYGPAVEWLVTDGDPAIDGDGALDGTVKTQFYVSQFYANTTIKLTAIEVHINDDGSSTSTGLTASVIFTDSVPTLPASPNGIDATATGNYAANGVLIYTFDAPNLPVGVPTSAGSFSPFLRIQHNTIEQGYNTNGTTQPDTVQGAWTHAIHLNDISITTVNGVAYRVFLLDLNEDRPCLSLVALKIYTASTNDLTGYTGSGFSNGSSTLRYDLDGGANGDLTIGLMDGHPHGARSGDYVLLVPYASLPNDASNPYVYVYASFGPETVGQADWATDGSYEQFEILT